MSFLWTPPLKKKDNKEVQIPLYKELLEPEPPQDPPKEEKEERGVVVIDYF